MSHEQIKVNLPSGYSEAFRVEVKPYALSAVAVIATAPLRTWGLRRSGGFFVGQFGADGELNEKSKSGVFSTALEAVKLMVDLSGWNGNQGMAIQIVERAMLEVQKSLPFPKGENS